MAQAQDTITMSGRSKGNLNYCTHCGGNLSLEEGTDPEQTESLGGFQETYVCDSCNRTGTYRFRNKDAKETFQGVCAGTHMWE